MTVYDLDQNFQHLSRDIYYNFDLSVIFEFVAMSIFTLYAYIILRFTSRAVASKIRLFFNPEPPPIPEECKEYYPVD